MRTPLCSEVSAAPPREGDELHHSLLFNFGTHRGIRTRIERVYVAYTVPGQQALPLSYVGVSKMAVFRTSVHFHAWSFSSPTCNRGARPPNP